MTKAKRKVELLAPAGDEEKLRAALHFGADAVYLALDRYGLRTASRNFSFDSLAEALAYAHERNAKVYVTMNIVAHEEDFDGLSETVKRLEKMGVDAVIVSDPGVFQVVRNETALPIHISTQASLMNAKAIQFWGDQGAERVVLARELSLSEMRTIRNTIDSELALECFVHGAMCISISGRCLLSNYMTGRDANRGDCAQACRWKYALMEEKRPGEYFPVVEEERGTFIMNSKDLCLLPYLPELIESGVDSLKIEGRVKSAYYVATVVHAYRMALNAIENGTWDAKVIDTCLKELQKTSHRAFTTGFFFGNPAEEGQNYASTSYIQEYDFIGVVTAVDEEKNTISVEVRNAFSVGDHLEMMTKDESFAWKVSAMYTADGVSLERAKTPKTIVYLPKPGVCSVGDMLRRAK